MRLATSDGAAVAEDAGALGAAFVDEVEAAAFFAIFEAGMFAGDGAAVVVIFAEGDIVFAARPAMFVEDQG